jgi:hypothetical protein
LFSRRTEWERAPNAWAARVERARAEVRLRLDLTESNPTRAGLAWDGGELAAAFADARAAAYDPAPRGLLACRQAVSAWLEGAGVAVPADRLVLTASTSEAYAFLLGLLADPGDAILVPQPSYPLFEHLARLAGVELVPYRLRLRDDGWRLDVEALLARMPHECRAVVVVHPNNPTGSCVRPGEALALAGACAERGVALVSDEVFLPFPWGEASLPSVLPVAARAGALTFALSGLSKSCGLPQAKLGWIAVDGPARLVDDALERLDVVADTYLSVSTPVQLAAPRLLERGAAFRQRALARIRANVGCVHEVAARAGARVLPADAGWTAIVELPPGRDEDEVAARALEEHGVLVHPGWLFDLPGSHVVVSLIVDPSSLRSGLPAALSV